MERLRAKASTYRFVLFTFKQISNPQILNFEIFRSAQDLCRATRTTLLDRRQAPDAADRVQLRASLEQLANAVPARDATSLADRLEAISKQVAARWTKRGVATLNFMAAPVHGCYYLSTDCFYVEINIEGSSGRVAEAKVHHIDSNHPNQQTSASKNCPEIIQCLTKGEFQRFIDHLEGLMAIYDIPNATAQDKTRGWNALALCEADLARLDFCSEQDIGVKINHGNLGFLQSRAGGLPLKMTYFVAPMEKLDVNTKNLRKLNAQIINDENIGVYATVGIEKCETPRHLPLGPLISENGAELPLNPNNSIQLPAGFVLHLGDFLALESSKYHEIVNITGISFVPDVSPPLPLFQLITKSFSDDHLDSSNNRGMFVTLPDQSHCYFLSDHKSMSGYKIKKIPFSHPGQVPRILAILRQQAVFNSVISSCIRSSGIQDLEKSILLEVSCMDLSRLCVTFEMSQGMATFELDFTDFQSVQCKLHKLSSNDQSQLNTLMTKQVFEKTLSLPLTMRSLIKQALKKSKIKPDPDPDPQVGLYNNGNLDNGNNVVPMDLDFPGRSLKVEPMDFESPTLSRKDHLNANRPQDAALNPGVRAQPSNKGLTPTPPKATATANTTKLRINQVEIKALKSKPANLALPFEQTKQAKKMGDPIKPSVSITPVSSADVIEGVKKPVGIEIIPLGDKLPSKYQLLF